MWGLPRVPRFGPSLCNAITKEGGIGWALGRMYMPLLGSVAFVWQQNMVFCLAVGPEIAALMTIEALMGGLLLLLLTSWVLTLLLPLGRS